MLPRINEHMQTAVITVLRAREGEELNIGARVLDLSIDLSSSAPHDCPAISYYSIALRERLWLRRLVVKPGDEIAPATLLATLSTEAADVLDEAPSRLARVTVAGIPYPFDLWGPSPA